MIADVSWGGSIYQFTFLVGVAASCSLVVLLYYLRNCKAFAKITVLGQFLAVACVTMCLTLIIVDLGHPSRAFNVLLHLTVNSVIFWHVVVLAGNLFLNTVIGWAVLASDRKSVPPPRWVKPMIYISVP